MFLFGMFSSAVVNASAIKSSLSLVTPFPKLRTLRLSGVGGAGNVEYSDMFDQSVDFSSLSALTLLEIGHPYKIKAPIVLPPSVTSIGLANVCCTVPVHEMDKLPFVLTVAFGLSSASLGTRTSFFEAVKWPGPIASLDIDLCDSNTSTIGRLPVGLERLTVVRGVSVEMLDLPDIVEHLTRLTCLNICDCNVEISRQLPPTLTSLQIWRLAISGSDTFVDIANRIPPSVTNLDIGNIHFKYNGSATPSTFDVERGVEHLLPNLGLVSQERLLGLVRECTNSDPSPSFLQRFRDVVSTHGLGVHYAEEMVCGKDAVDGHFCLERVARLMHLNCTDQEIRRIVNGRGVTHGYFHCDWHSDGGHIYLNSCVRMLALGYTDTFNFAKAASHVDCSMKRPLPANVACNIAKLIISTDTHKQLEDFLLASGTFGTVRVFVRLKSTHSVCLCLDVIYKYRQKFPRLERVEFDTLCSQNGIAFGSKTLGQLHEMRLYVNTEENCLSYYVGRESPSTANVIK
jgi:hypothetical protein